MFSKPSILNRNEDNSNKGGRSLSSANTLSASLSNQTARPTPAPVAPPEVTPAPSSAVVASNSEPVIGARLIVGPDVKLKGAEILDCDTLVVEGRVEATMDSRVIRIADKGAFSGKVSIDIAEIHGTFEGELTARSQLIIHATGKVSGKIRYGTLVIDEGGELCGDISTLSAEKRPSASPVSDFLPTLNAVAS